MRPLAVRRSDVIADALKRKPGSTALYLKMRYTVLAFRMPFQHVVFQFFACIPCAEGYCGCAAAVFKNQHAGMRREVFAVGQRRRGRRDKRIG